MDTLRRALAQSLPGQLVQLVQVRQRQLRWPVPDDLERQLTGATFAQFSRRAKYLLMHTDKGCLIAHLGMSGVFRLLSGELADAADNQPHNHLVLHLHSGDRLLYQDPRRFGSLHWVAPGDDPARHPLLASLGPEPLLLPDNPLTSPSPSPADNPTDNPTGADAVFDAAHLQARCRGRKAPIKALLMDSRVVAGLGNIYACEALFAAGIRPDRAAGRVKAARLATLVQAVREVLQRALRAGGTSIKDFRNADGTPGYFALQLSVYGRKGEPCRTCSSPIKSIVMSGRSTFFCARCQR